MFARQTIADASNRNGMNVFFYRTFQRGNAGPVKSLKVSTNQPLVAAYAAIATIPPALFAVDAVPSDCMTWTGDRRIQIEVWHPGTVEIDGTYAYHWDGEQLIRVHHASGEETDNRIRAAMGAQIVPVLDSERDLGFKLVFYSYATAAEREEQIENARALLKGYLKTAERQYEPMTPGRNRVYSQIEGLAADLRHDLTDFEWSDFCAGLLDTMTGRVLSEKKR